MNNLYKKLWGMLKIIYILAYLILDNEKKDFLNDFIALTLVTVGSRSIYKSKSIYMRY